MQHVQVVPAGAAPSIIVLNTRESIEAAVEALVECLDDIDGDPDREPECDVGEEEFGERLGYLTLVPIYAADQTGPPDNRKEALRAHREALLRGEDPTGDYLTAAEKWRRLGVGSLR